MDNSGNIIVGGIFSSDTIRIGKYLLSNKNIPSYKGTAFFAKYDADGRVAWVKKIAGDGGTEQINATVCDKAGNIYLQGTMTSTEVDFDKIRLSLVSYQDIFIAKYDKNGKALWAKNTANDSLSIAWGLAIDNKGGLYSAGTYFGSYIYLGKDTLRNINPATADMFIQNFDSAGNILWDMNMGGIGDDMAYSTTCNSKGHVYVSGSIQNSKVTFGTTTLQALGSDSSVLFLGRLGDKKVITSLEAEAPTEGINIFPNPSEGKYTIAFRDKKANAFSYELYNMAGQRILNVKNIKEASITIDISERPTGVYFLKTNSSNNISTCKLIKY